jgi:hypothetical protein
MKKRCYKKIILPQEFVVERYFMIDLIALLAKTVE